MDLRTEYMWIHFIMKQTDLARKQKLEMLKDSKHKVRAINKKIETNVINGGSNNIDSYWYKEYFDYAFTEEEKETFIEENWIRIPNSPYDCTARWFTSRICVFNVESSYGKAVAYHFMNCDV